MNAQNQTIKAAAKHYLRNKRFDGFIAEPELRAFRAGAMWVRKQDRTLQWQMMQRVIKAERCAEIHELMEYLNSHCVVRTPELEVHMENVQRYLRSLPK